MKLVFLFCTLVTWSVVGDPDHPANGKPRTAVWDTQRGGIVVRSMTGTSFIDPQLVTMSKRDCVVTIDPDLIFKSRFVK